MTFDITFFTYGISCSRMRLVTPSCVCMLIRRRRLHARSTRHKAIARAIAVDPLYIVYCIICPAKSWLRYKYLTHMMAYTYVLDDTASSAVYLYR